MQYSYTLLTIYVLLFLLGTMLGSFMNVLLYRIHENKKGILFGRSCCPSCKNTLKPFDLIPLVSYLLLRGKCRYCQKKISSLYPLVEATTGIVFMYIFWAISTQYTSFEGWQLAIFLLYAFFLVAISFYDLLHYEIPDVFSFPAIAIAAIICIISAITNSFAPTLFSALIGVAIATIFFGGQVVISKETWLGWGDVLIGIFMGLILGWEKTLVAIFASYVIGAVISLLLLARKKKTMNSQVPFGPFLSLGTLIALGLGDTIIRWYLSFLT